MWQNWVILLSILIVALAFVALVIFLILTLVSLTKTIKTTNALCVDLEDKMHALDPLARAVSNVGQVIENKTQHVAEELGPPYRHESSERRIDSRVNTVIEVAEWALVGLALWGKIKERR